MKQGFTHIVSIGGDGTSSEIVNAVAGENIVFGVIPMGSGNDFPKACGIPLDFTSALENLVDGKIRNVDVGVLGDRLFINGLGIGLDGAVAHRFGTLKMFGGFLGYLIGAVIEAFKFKGFGASLRFDDMEESGKYLLCGACNGPFQGGKFKLAPDADVADGLLDLYFIDDMPPLSRLIKIPKVLEGTHSEMPEVTILQVKDADLVIERDLPAHMDGEPINLLKGKYNISVRKHALGVILPVN